MLKTEEREQWLTALQVGDEVAYRAGGSYRYWVIAKITRITPTRRLILSNGSTINPDGSIRGDKHFYIHPVTDEINMDIWRRRTIQKIRNELKIDNLSNDSLKIILGLLK